MSHNVLPASSDAIRRASKATIVLQTFSAVLLVGLAALFVIIGDRYANLQDGIRENALWSVYQLDREARKLHEAVHDALLEHDGSAATLKLISNRYDILYSRMKILEDGNFDKKFGGDRDAGPAMATIQATIHRFEPTFDAFGRTGQIDAKAMQELDAALEPMIADTESLLIYANNAVSSDRAEARAALMSLQLKSAVLVGLLVCCVGFLILSLRRQLSSVRAAGLSIEAMAEDLRRSYLAAEAGNRAKSQFMATMGHEIRTPLNAILGTTELLELPNSGLSVPKGLTTIRKSGEALLEIINEILDYAKLDHGKLEIELRATTVEETVRSVMEILDDRVRENGNEMRALFPETPRFPVIECDPTRLRQILLNLVSNAAKFTSNGIIVVKVSEHVRDTRATLRFDVIDTGIGIDEEGLARLFQPFSQVDATITRRFGGTGLGLTICKEIVERLGGSIGVDSSKGVGSSFWFELPAVAAEPPAMSVRPKPDGATESPGLSILLVEDNRVNQEMAASFLRHLGQEVEIAADGVEAVRKAADADFDLILMDMQMPNMDGIEATRRIRAFAGARGKVPIVAMTANASEDDKLLCEQAGMDGFQSKPVSMEKLRETIRRWAGDHGGSPQVPSLLLDRTFEERRLEMVAVLGEEGFASLVASFFEDAGGLIEQLRAALETGDTRLRDHLLHTAKGAASSIGMRTLADSCQTFREQGMTTADVRNLETTINGYRHLLAA